MQTFQGWCEDFTRKSILVFLFCVLNKRSSLQVMRCFCLFLYATTSGKLMWPNVCPTFSLICLSSVTLSFLPIHSLKLLENELIRQRKNWFIHNRCRHTREHTYAAVHSNEDEVFCFFSSLKPSIKPRGLVWPFSPPVLFCHCCCAHY